ncbi:flagellar hook protein FlgE [Thiocystis violascens]|uniref:Flagellar hook protein FlgE n=1 Tax=Thiocystis violascens (strain ATCC 17096 / DSM 198 / 6111) TaxID=765911 RepID=I3Y649_THIV6|nr:flagellar hook protein FlgE [Thiocystis violascens]AFL72467.1 flagellar hook-basal body protein [Thiocystis violascens DSM 198]
MAFNIGLSGLTAAAADLKVTGNNIANVGTIGFKGSRAEFGDIFTRSYGTIGKTNIGAGVRLISNSQQFTQGTLEFTDNSLDMSITGRGFFVLNSAGSDDNVYTRAGAFQVDNEGYIVNNGSPPMRLQGFPPTDPTDPNSLFRTGLRSDMQINLGDSPPNATAEIAAQLNLRSDASNPIDETVVPQTTPPTLIDPTVLYVAPVVDPVTGLVTTPAVPGFNIDDPDTYNFSTSTTIYDSLGTPRPVTMYFIKDEVNAAAAGGSSVWQVHVQMDGENTGASPPTFPTNSPMQLEFDTNGLLIPPTSADLTFDMTKYDPVNGATVGEDDPTQPVPPPSTVGTNIISLDFTGTTQYGERYAVSSLEQDGYTTGRITGVDADEEGVLFIRYSNGRALPLGQVALADFDNPQGLQQIGDTSWAETTDSGGPVIFSPGTGSLGNIQGGALETANVDLATELVNLITAQRNYQANSQTISAANQITQTILNIR